MPYHTDHELRFLVVVYILYVITVKYSDITALLSQYGVPTLWVTIAFILWVLYEDVFALLQHASVQPTVITNVLGVAFVLASFYGNGIEKLMSLTALVVWGIYLNVIGLRYRV